jgi:hypothetical protein
MAASNPTVALTYGAVAVSLAFSQDSNSTTGTLDMNLGLNNGDITPAISPTDDATFGNTALVYVSLYNPMATTLRFGATTITVTDSSGFGGATTCELDNYVSGGGPIAAGWASSGSTGAVSGDSVTIAPSVYDKYITFSPGGQFIQAVSCN